jgi:hypothetical protein
MEKLWAEQVAADEFILCCIPFFTYGMALGDRVRTALEGDKQHVIIARVQASGRLVYRCWFGDVDPAVKDDARVEAERVCRQERWWFEWSSTNLLAVDLPSVAYRDRFDDVFHSVQKFGVAVEDGTREYDDEDFGPPESGSPGVIPPSSPPGTIINQEMISPTTTEETPSGSGANTTQAAPPGTERVRISFKLIQDNEPPALKEVERVWAHPGEAEGEYIIDNIPFYAREATIDDVVSVRREADRLWFDQIIRPSKNSLIQVTFRDSRHHEAVETHLAALGCIMEYDESDGVLAVSIPETVDLSRVQSYLRNEANLGDIVYEEPILRRRHPAPQSVN